MRLDAYYYGFNATGVELIDRILSAIACAGKASHHTESWNDKIETPYEPFFKGGTPIEWIQNAANDAAGSPAPFSNLARAFDLLAKGCRSMRLDRWEDRFDLLRQDASRAVVDPDDIVEIIDYDYRNNLDGRAAAKNMVDALVADIRAAQTRPIAAGDAVVLDGIDLRAPLPELKGAKPVVMYFGSDEDREEFLAIVKEAKPGMIARKL